MDKIPAGTFRAPSNFPIQKEKLKSLCLESAKEVLSQNSQFEGSELSGVLNQVVAEFNRCFLKMEELQSINQYPHYRRQFDRQAFIENNPELAESVDSFCFIFRAKIALMLYPEKIEMIATELKNESKETWRPEFLDTKERVNTKQWLGANIRNAQGKIDWRLIQEKVAEIYPCDFEYNEPSEAYTLESATKLTQELLDKEIEEKGHWNPTSALTASLYDFLTQQKQFRREARRPDLQNRINTRPNWFAIADFLGDQYRSTLRIGWWNAEQKYRDFDDTIDELIDLLHARGYPQWSLTTISRMDANVYAWFKSHCRLAENEDGIDIAKILQACPSEVKEKYEGRVA